MKKDKIFLGRGTNLWHDTRILEWQRNFRLNILWIFSSQFKFLFRLGAFFFLNYKRNITWSHLTKIPECLVWVSHCARAARKSGTKEKVSQLFNKTHTPSYKHSECWDRTEKFHWNSPNLNHNILSQCTVKSLDESNSPSISISEHLLPAQSLL